jgi:hypothetical protein
VNKPWYWCATCGRWSTTHSTNGLTHNDKTISRHEQGGSPKKKRNDQQSSSQLPSKKSKSSNLSSVNGLQSHKAEINQQNNSSVFDLIKATAGEQ